ncbi:MAG: hypothetical protein QXL67_03245 [Candidatus Bathyarchaeia archaeon]
MSQKPEGFSPILGIDVQNALDIHIDTRSKKALLPYRRLAVLRFSLHRGGRG